MTRRSKRMRKGKMRRSSKRMRKGRYRRRKRRRRWRKEKVMVKVCTFKH